jgi:uncharacterized protein YfaT (DUF1175 family)
MRKLAFLALVLLSCSRPVLKVVASRTVLLANGYDHSILKIYGATETPHLEVSGDRTYLRIIKPHQGDEYWEAELQAGVMPGTVHVNVTSGDQHVEQQIILQPQNSDSASDGTPDILRLDEESDRNAFRNWLTYLAEIQYFISPKNRPSEITDCSALVRYVYREAMRDHNAAWLAGAHLPLIQAQASIQKYSFPHTPLGANIFRTRPGTYSAGDMSNGTFAEFADAQTLQRFNMFFISRDIERAQPGDILFYRRQVTKGVSYHSMVFLGHSKVKPDSEIYVIYHTGPDGTNQGEIRRLTLTQLLHFPDPQWQAISANAFFLGVYRWNILKALP